MAEDQVIAHYHQRLNHPDVVPGRFYRRNHEHYPLVCCVNNIIGLYLSDRFDSIPLFLARADRHLQERMIDQHAEYRSVVGAYLRHMAQFIMVQRTVDPEIKGLIPAHLLARDLS